MNGEYDRDTFQIEEPEDSLDYSAYVNKGIEENDDYLNELNKSLANQICAAIEGNDNCDLKRTSVKKRIIYVLSSFILVFMILVITPLGKKVLSQIIGEILYSDLDYKEKNPQGYDTTVTNQNINNNENSSQINMAEDHIINILLVGIEEIKNAKNTDAMIIASINPKENTLKLISLMRDSYVEIQGYNKNKLNAAYSIGGIELLYDTMTLNFGLNIDGYLLFNFETFEKVIDILGGVEVTLTKGEAAYLNKHNYISNSNERNVVVGTQVLSGNQALGYCRVRGVSTGTENDDFGRTQRQRSVIKAMISALKSQNLFELTKTIDKILDEVNIETDITKAEFKKYLEVGMNLKFNSIENLRIPSNGSYYDGDVLIGKNMQAVLIYKDFDKTVKEIEDFIMRSVSNNGIEGKNQ